jgi:hydroxyethylthiazole kinase-like sugar kinase family protein
VVNYAAGETGDADSTPASPNTDMICAAVSAAVSAGVHAALDAVGETDSALADDEAELLDAYRNAGELHRTTALRTLQRGVDTKDD